MSLNTYIGANGVVATKLGIILSSSSSMHVLPNLRAAIGPERSGGPNPSDLVFLLGFGRRSACTMGKRPFGERDILTLLP